MSKMLILRGNSGTYVDENGKPHKYAKGALHESPAKEYARRKGYEGVVLDVSGDPPPKGKGDRSRSAQTIEATDKFLRDDTITAFYGFSGGGYNIWWILHGLTEKDLKRIKLIVVLGAPDRPKSEYEASAYNLKGGGWELVYLTNPPQSHKVVPKGAGSHMFGPEWLLSQTPDPNSTSP